MKFAAVVGGAVVGGVVGSILVLRNSLNFRRWCVAWGFHFIAGRYKNEWMCICGLRGKQLRLLAWFDKAEFRLQLHRLMARVFPPHRGRGAPINNTGVYWGNHW